MRTKKRRLLALLEVRKQKIIERFEAMSEATLTREINKITSEYPQLKHFIESFELGEKYLTIAECKALEATVEAEEEALRKAIESRE